MVDFDGHMSKYQTEWRCKNPENQVQGVQNGKERPWILGWGEMVEVLEPKELREEIVNTAKSMVKVYQKGKAF